MAVAAVGGEDAFARGLRCAPWEAFTWSQKINWKYLSAAALLAQTSEPHPAEPARSAAA